MPLLPHERDANMPEHDPLVSPPELHRMEPKFSVAMQREHRKAGDFIPHIQIGTRIYYRLSSIRRFLAEKETTVQVMDDAEQEIEDGDHDDAA